MLDFTPVLPLFPSFCSCLRWLTASCFLYCLQKCSQRHLSLDKVLFFFSSAFEMISWMVGVMVNPKLFSLFVHWKEDETLVLNIRVFLQHWERKSALNFHMSLHQKELGTRHWLHLTLFSRLQNNTLNTIGTAVNDCTESQLFTDRYVFLKLTLWEHLRKLNWF